MQAIKDDFKIMWTDRQKLYDEFQNNIIKPMKTLLTNHSKLRDSMDEAQRKITSKLVVMKSALEFSKTKYHEAVDKFNKNMENFEQEFDSMSEEESSKIAVGINNLLMNCKEREKDYITQIYATKNHKIKLYVSSVNSLSKYRVKYLEIIKIWKRKEY